MKNYLRNSVFLRFKCIHAIRHGWHLRGAYRNNIKDVHIILMFIIIFVGLSSYM